MISFLSVSSKLICCIFSFFFLMMKQSFSVVFPPSLSSDLVNSCLLYSLPCSPMFWMSPPHQMTFKELLLWSSSFVLGVLSSSHLRPDLIAPVSRSMLEDFQLVSGGDVLSVLKVLTNYQIINYEYFKICLQNRPSPVCY